MRRKFLLGLAFAIIAQVAAAFAQEPAAGASHIVSEVRTPGAYTIVPERLF
jgi:hypothetical protein